MAPRDDHWVDHRFLAQRQRTERMHADWAAEDRAAVLDRMTTTPTVINRTASIRSLVTFRRRPQQRSRVSS